MLILLLQDVLRLNDKRFGGLSASLGNALSLVLLVYLNGLNTAPLLAQCVIVVQSTNISLVDTLETKPMTHPNVYHAFVLPC